MNYARTRTQIMADLEIKNEIFCKYLTDVGAKAHAAQLRGSDDYESLRNLTAKASSIINNNTMLINSLKKELTDPAVDPTERMLLEAAIIKDTKYEYRTNTAGLKGGLGLLRFMLYEVRQRLENSGASKARKDKIAGMQRESRELVENMKVYKTRNYKFGYRVVSI